ncbi:MBL fold metallo-hydrolase [Fusobacterium sp.]|uniref:MBL fold metallo-hydrolase n=1 Tax=Fusobacterium sp. TaxID=68766 RepID=UPI00396C4AFA
MRIYYIYHSGFAIETENHKLIFDFYKTTGYNIGDFDLERFLTGDKKITVFSSHRHGDHFNPEILKWKERDNITYILSNDIDVEEKIKNIYMVKPGDILEIDGIKVEVFGSTDEGVSFYVECDKTRFFHSGDLNWWHWSDDTPQEFKYMKDLYFGIIDNIKNSIKEVDYLFYPVDPRLEENSFSGVEYFIDNINVKNIIPMHCWNNFKIGMELREKLKGRNVNVIVSDKNLNRLV